MGSKSCSVASILSFRVIFIGLAAHLVSGAPKPNLAGSLQGIASELKEKKAQKTAAAQYFLKYGYLQDFADSDDENLFSESIKNFQKFAGLNQTGKLDEKTKKQFTIPRCGLQDPIKKISRRQKRYLLQGAKWDLSKHAGRTLTWMLENTGRNLKKEDVRKELTKAFGIWQKHANIFFKETTDANADIRVKFANGCHQDPFCFDFRGGTLAHAFYPYPGQAISGDVHFDNDEYYVIQKSTGTDLLWVAVHEIGHSLGLEHSNVQGAIMYPWYQGYKADFDLTSDDQAGIQALYGAAIQKPQTTVKVTTQKPTTQKPTTQKPTTQKPTTQKPTTQKPTTQKPTTQKPTTQKPTTKKQETVTTKKQLKTTEAVKPDPTTSPSKPTKRPKFLPLICPKYMDSSYISIRFKWMIVVSGLSMYLANRNGFRHGPLVKNNYFPRIKGTIDSAMVNSVTGETIIFSANNFYIYREFMHIAGPYPLTDLGFSKDIQKVDASLKWKRNGQYYIFSKDLFWRFNPTKPGIVKEGYPKKIRDWWKGVPDYLSTATTDFDNITRFTKGEQYYTLIDSAVRVEHVYPERIGDNWMKCGVTSPVPTDKVKEYTGPLVAEP